MIIVNINNVLYLKWVRHKYLSVDGAWLLQYLVHKPKELDIWNKIEISRAFDKLREMVVKS